jgi:hypothetical protein
LPGDKEFTGVGKINLQTLDGRADMACCEAGSCRDPRCAAQLAAPLLVANNIIVANYGL